MPIPAGATCEHPEMEECHEGCRHWSCLECGLYFDDASDFPLETDEERDTYLAEQLADVGGAD